MSKVKRVWIYSVVHLSQAPSSKIVKHLFLPVDWWRYIDYWLTHVRYWRSDKPYFWSCTSTRSSLLGNIKEERIYDPIPNVLLPHLGFKISLRASERQMQNPWISNSRFWSDSGCGGFENSPGWSIYSIRCRPGRKIRQKWDTETNKSVHYT